MFSVHHPSDFMFPFFSVASSNSKFTSETIRPLIYLVRFLVMESCQSHCFYTHIKSRIQKFANKSGCLDPHSNPRSQRPCIRVCAAIVMTSYLFYSLIFGGCLSYLCHVIAVCTIISYKGGKSHLQGGLLKASHTSVSYMPCSVFRRTGTGNRFTMT